MADNNTLQQMMPDSASFSADEKMAFLEKNGMINSRDVEEMMRKARKEQILKEHPYKIYQGKDGRWRTHLPDDDKDEGRKLIVKTSRGDLEKLVIDHYVATHEEEIRRSYTLEDLYPEWMEYKSLHVADNTANRVTKDWNKYYKNDPIVKKPIVSLTMLELDTWVHRKLKNYPMNNHQYGNFSLIIRQMLDYAVAKEIVDSNLFKLVKVDKKRVLVQEKKKPDHTQVYTESEEKLIIEHAWEAFRKDRNYVQHFVPLAVVFMFYTGLRVGELASVRFSDIEGTVLHVQRIVRYPSGEIIDHTKGTFGDREVPLIPKAIAIIDAVIKKRIELGLGTDEYIFCPNKNPLNTYTSIQKEMSKYCRELEMPVKSPHKVRKTVLSDLIDAGINLNTVRLFAGHKDERTTLNNYCYDRDSVDEKYAKIANALS